MKKTKLLILTLALVIILLGTGYAYWTDALTINNTVSTGELKVEFVDDYVYPRAGAGDGTQTNYATAIIDQSNPKLTTVTLNNMYPGVMALYSTKFENKGTIPAVIDGVDIIYSESGESEPLNDKLLLQVHVQHWSNKKLIDGKVLDCTLGEFPNVINDSLKEIRLEKGEHVALDFIFSLPSTVENEDNVEKQTIVFDIELKFKQHNAQ